jgi:hypothetical protein
MSISEGFRDAMIPDPNLSKQPWNKSSALQANKQFEIQFKDGRKKIYNITIKADAAGALDSRISDINALVTSSTKGTDFERKLKEMGDKGELTLSVLETRVSVQTKGYSEVPQKATDAPSSSVLEGETKLSTPDPHSLQLPKSGIREHLSEHHARTERNLSKIVELVKGSKPLNEKDKELMDQEKTLLGNEKLLEAKVKEILDKLKGLEGDPIQKQKRISIQRGFIDKKIGFNYKRQELIRDKIENYDSIISKGEKGVKKAQKARKPLTDLLNAESEKLKELLKELKELSKELEALKKVS